MEFLKRMSMYKDLTRKITNICKGLTRRASKENNPDAISPTFCILPWIHMATHTGGNVTPCCISPPLKDENLNKKSFSDVWNGMAMKSLRKKMLNGEKSSLCTRCYEEEDSGVASHRKRSNIRWGKQLSFKNLLARTDAQGYYNGSFLYLDLRLGNKCNLECNMCSPEETVRWEKLIPKVLGHATNKNLKDFLKKRAAKSIEDDPLLKRWYEKGHVKRDIYDNLSPLKQVTIAGGEPLLIDEHHEFLDECILRNESHHISIHYHTNGTVLNHKLFEKWKHFESVMVFISVDDLGERNRYIRYPTSWKKIEQNLDFIDRESPKNVHPMILCTIQALNIYYFPEFIEWVVRKKFKKVHAYYDSVVHTEPLHQPYYLSCQILPRHVKKIITEKFMTLYDKYGAKAERFKTLINFMNKEDKEKFLCVFLDYLESLDKTRGTNFRETFSELSNLIQIKKGFQMSKTFCVLPWMHLSTDPSGKGRLCCDGFEHLKGDDKAPALWKKAENLQSYFNSTDYKRIRLQMLKGERPSHCFHCFNQEDHGMESMRMHHNRRYNSQILRFLEETNNDGSVHNPRIFYLDIPMGNACNLKCRMCSPWNSYAIARDWKKMGKDFDAKSARDIFKDAWYESPKAVNLIKEALPEVREIFLTGGEPMLLKGHRKLLEMIRESGHAEHITVRYNSNQTIIPNDIVHLWKSFESIQFNCSVEAYGTANNYIRYPSKWEKQLKNIHYLDELSFKNDNILIYIHTTLQAYNIASIPMLLDYLRYAEFKSLHRIPFFIWVKVPAWLCPAVLPADFKGKAVLKIQKRLEAYEDFFLNYNEDHTAWNRDRIKQLREFCHMIENEKRIESDFDLFIKETRQLDRLRNQSVEEYLPELASFLIYLL